MAQRGWITKHDRKKKGSVWVYHWYVIKPETGRKAEHTCVVGSVASFPREKDAWLEIDRRHIKPQLDQGAVTHWPLNLRRSCRQLYAERDEEAGGDNPVHREALPGRLPATPLGKECCSRHSAAGNRRLWLGSLPRSNPTKDKIRRIMSTVYTRAQKYGLVPRSDSSNPVRWVEQTAKSGYKPIVLEPATAAKIFEALSGAELALAILVAATGIRISEAMGLKWEDVDYQNKQINLRPGLGKGHNRGASQDGGLRGSRTAHRSAGQLFTGLAKGNGVRAAKRLGFRQRKKQGADAEIEQRSDWGLSPSGSDCRRGEAQEGATVRLPQLPPRAGKLAGEPGDGCQDGAGASPPLERQDNAWPVHAPGEFVDVGRAGLDDAGVAARIANRSIG